MLKGIEPGQQVSELPTDKLLETGEDITAIIGTSMARDSKLNTGDYITVRWRDVDGTFDAAEVLIVDVFRCDVPAIDNGQMWISIDRLQEMTQMPGEATLLVTDQDFAWEGAEDGWILRDHDYLLQDMNDMIKMKKVGGSFFYMILMLLAFDFQKTEGNRDLHGHGYDTRTGGQIVYGGRCHALCPGCNPGRNTWDSFPVLDGQSGIFYACRCG